LGINNRSRLQHDVSRCALGGNYREDRVDRDRHFKASLGGKASPAS